jgi:hypothetical protein
MNEQCSLIILFLGDRFPAPVQSTIDYEKFPIRLQDVQMMHVVANILAVKGNECPVVHA